VDLKSTKKELEAAYERLEKTEKQLSNLLLERRDTNRILEVLKAAGFLTDKKLYQAREIIMADAWEDW